MKNLKVIIALLSVIVAGSTLWASEPTFSCSQMHLANLYGHPATVTLGYIPADEADRVSIGYSDSLALTSAIAAANGAEVAINGSFFDMERGNSVGFLKLGQLTVDSTSMGMAINGAIRCGAGRGVEIMKWNKEKERAYRQTEGAILATGPVLLLGGEEVAIDNVPDSFGLSRHPRTAIGVMPDGAVLFLTVDGRHQGDSEGISLGNLARLMKAMGCRDAINLDGGGSTTFWTASEGIQNYPCDNRRYDHEGERRVPTIVFLK